MEGANATKKPMRSRKSPKTLNKTLKKYYHHGKRADGIVKGMLQHSRTGSGTKEPTDINALADEYLRLAYHGLRAKDKSFNAKMETNFDNPAEVHRSYPSGYWQSLA